MIPVSFLLILILLTSILSMRELEKIKFLDNSLDNWLWITGIMIIVFIFKRYISKMLGSLIYTLFRRYSKENKVKIFNELVLAPAQWMILLIILSFSVNLLRYPTMWNIDFHEIHLRIILNNMLKLMLSLSFTWFVLRITDFIGVLMADRATLTESKLDDMLVPFIKDSIKVVIMVTSLFFILSNIFEVNIASLIAGVGIGGLAIALAAQESLKNIFASVTIFLDKPFTIGDIVQVGQVTGTIENIGFRSTRLRTYNKTFVTLPNKLMIETSVDNLSMRTFRFVKTTIILSYETGKDKLESIVKAISSYMEQADFIEKDYSVRFNEFRENGFEIALEYNIREVEFNSFMELKEKVNFAIAEIINTQGGQYAQSSRIVELKK
ncbi:MAG: mechanosensitive ion channel family protein [Bacteroidota bacterium]|jgi:MscS family membrane protein